MMKKNDPIEFIADNKEKFQVNFSLITPKKRVVTKGDSMERMINLDKYQTKEVIVDFFYKAISRTIK